jgi:hypothetical protein
LKRIKPFRVTDSDRMDLSTIDYDAMACLSKKVRVAQSLSDALDLLDDRRFSFDLKASSDLFPLTFDRYHALRWKSLAKLSPKQKDGLKEVLESEIDPALEESKLKAQQTKTILGEMLPTDLGDCIRSLKEIRDAKLLEIRKLNDEKEQIEDAQRLIELLQEDQGTLERLRAKRRKTSSALSA